MKLRIDELVTEENYPVMPETFHNALVEVIGENIEGIQRFDKKRHIKKWIVIPVAALIGMTVFAAREFRIPEKMGWKIGIQEIEKIIDSEVDVITSENNPRQVYVEEGAEYTPDLLELPEESALMEIEETLFDGVRLIIYGKTTEAGKNYILGSDRIFINGEECGPVETGWSTDDPEEYIFEVDVSDLCLTEAFEVILPLSVYENTIQEVYSYDEPEKYKPPIRYKNQELRFVVEIPEAAGIVIVSDQYFEQDGMTLELQKIEHSATTLIIDFYYHVSEKLMQEFEEDGKVIVDPVLVLADNTVIPASGSFTINGPQEGIQDGYLISCEYRAIPFAETEVVIQTRLMRIDEQNSENKYEIYAENILDLSK